MAPSGGNGYAAVSNIHGKNGLIASAELEGDRILTKRQGGQIGFAQNDGRACHRIILTRYKRITTIINT